MVWGMARNLSTSLSCTELHRAPGAAIRKIVTRETGEIIVTERGVPVARILPYSADDGPALAIARGLEAASA